jgi:hypothetical protein
MHSFLRWREVLLIAPDAKTVNAIMRDYVDSLGPLTGALPAECQEALNGALDLRDAAVTLLQTEMSYAEVGELLHEVAHTFAAAAVRLTMIHGRPVPAAA